MKKTFKRNEQLFPIDGEYYIVDIEAKIKKDSAWLNLDDNSINKDSSIAHLANNAPSCKKIIASTNKSLDGIYHFSIEENVEELADKAYMKDNSVNCEDDVDYMRGFLKGYKEAKAKEYSKGQVRKAVLKGRLRIDGHSPKYTLEEIFQSLQPKIESIEVEYEEYMTEGWVPTYNNPDNNNLDISAEMDYRPKLNSKGELIVKVNYDG